MMHRLPIRLLFLVFLAFLLPAKASSLQEKTIPLCIAVTGYHSDTPNKPGMSPIAKKIIELAYNDSPYSIYFRTLPQRRALREVKSGHCDALGGAVYDSASNDHYEFSNYPMTQVEVVFFKLKTREFSWQSVEDLSGLVIGSGDGLEEALQLLDSDSITFSNLSSHNKNSQNFLRLASKRIDLLLMSRLQGYRVIAEKLPPEYRDQFDTVEKPVFAAPIYMMFSKNIDDLEAKKTAFDRGLLKITQDGTLDRLYSEHIYQLKQIP